MAEAPKEREHRLEPGRFHEAGYARNQWVVNAELGATREDFLNPAYWANFAVKLRPYDLVEIRKEDGTYWGMYVVLGADRTYATLHPVVEANLSTRDVSQTKAARYIYQWKGPQKQHCIIRTSDGEIVHEGAQTKPDAMRWLQENEKVLG